MMEENNTIKVCIEIPLPSKRLAEIAYHTLRVDSEPKRSGVVKELLTKDNILIGNFSALTSRQLRVAINGFFESTNLVVETLNFVGPPKSEIYSHFE